MTDLEIYGFGCLLMACWVFSCNWKQGRLTNKVVIVTLWPLALTAIAGAAFALLVAAMQKKQKGKWPSWALRFSIWMQNTK